MYTIKFCIVACLVFCVTAAHASLQRSDTLPDKFVLENNYFEDFSSYSLPVKMVYRTSGYHAFFYDQYVVFRFHNGAHAGEWNEIRMDFKNSVPGAYIRTERPLAATSNYFSGAFLQKKKQSGALVVPRYQEIIYKNIYTHIDVRFYVRDGNLEYDFNVHRSGNPEDIRLEFSGATSIHEAKGALQLTNEAVTLTQHAPYVYQVIHGERKKVQADYVIIPRNTNAVTHANEGKAASRIYQVAFRLSAYNKNVPLIIDPVLTHVTYLGGSNEDEITDLALDSQGNLYVLGVTRSVDLPIKTPALQAQINALEDVFVAKFLVGKNGFTQIFSSYIGGSGSDTGQALVIDATGNIILAGATDSTDFPVVSQAFQSSLKGMMTDGFVLSLNNTGNQINHATYYGGTGNDFVKDIAFLNDDSLYVAGDTGSNDLPLAGVQNKGLSDVFFAHFNSNLTAVLSARYWGGAGNDTLAAIAVDATDNLYLTGQTLSSDFPVSTSFQTVSAGEGDAFITKINADNSLGYSRYIGGKYKDFATGVAVNAKGEAYVFGFTESPDMPVTTNVWQSAIADDTRVLDPLTGTGPDPLNPIGDAFLSQVKRDGSGFVYSTYIGGKGLELPGNISIDDNNLLYISGSTRSANIFDRFVSGSANISGNAFGAIFDTTQMNANAQVFSSIISGNQQDIARAVVAEPVGQAFYIAGRVESTNFSALNALQTTHAGGVSDGFISKFGIGVDLDAFVGFQQGTLIPVGKGLPETLVHSVVNNGPDTATNIQVEITVPANVQFNSLRVVQGSTDCGTAVPDQNLKIFCTITNLLNSDSARIDIIVTPPDTGRVVFNVKAQADEADTDPSNNSDTFSTIVANFPGEGNTGIPNARTKPGTGFSGLLLWIILGFGWCTLTKSNKTAWFRCRSAQAGQAPERLN